jgi:hypothetical protein
MSAESVSLDPPEISPFPFVRVDRQDKIYMDLMWSLQARGEIAHVTLITQDLFNEGQLEEPFRTTFFGMLCFLIDQGDIVKTDIGVIATAEKAKELDLTGVSKYPGGDGPQPLHLRMPTAPPPPRRFKPKKS